MARRAVPRPLERPAGTPGAGLSTTTSAALTDAGGTVAYAYDTLNRVVSVTEPGNKLTTLAYNADDQPTVTTLPNGVVVSRSYTAGRLTGIESKLGSATLARSVYTFTTITPAGEPQRDAGLVKTVLDQAGETISYGYDPDQGFLTSAVKRNGSGAIVGGYDYGYAYDLMGNRTSETVNGVTTSSVFNDANQLTSRGTTSYSYDAAGNLLSSSAGAAYSYNSLNQSTSIKRAGGSAQSQVYAGASQFERIEKDNGAGTTTQFGESILGTLIRKQGTGTYYTRLPDGSLLSQRTPAGTHYYLEDGLGTIVGMTDANGAVVAEYRYDPYGWVLYEKSGSPYNPWRFKSGYQSQTTLHSKFGHRWYDPQTGRWTQADPLEQPTSPGDWDRYAYVGGDAVNLGDPSGLHWVHEIQAVVIGGVIGGAVAAIPGVGPTVGAAAGGCAYGGVIAALHKRSGAAIFIGCLRDAAVAGLGAGVAFRAERIFGRIYASRR